MPHANASRCSGLAPSFRALDLQAARSPRAYGITKRSIDVVIAAFGLVALLPLWIVIGLAIRLTSPGPALFRRVVVGHNGRPFTYYKFRSMTAGDDRHHREWISRFVLADAPYAGGRYKVVRDPRVTPVGALLRRTSLDEAPQLINVLLGQMSLVGPRPPLPFEFELYDESAKRRLSVRPGITGLYQVTARSAVPFSKMVSIDLDYIARRSLFLDLCILLHTFGVMASGEGAG